MGRLVLHGPRDDRVWAVIIGLVVWVVRQFRPGPGQGQRSTALSILEERLARASHEEEFRRRKQTLLGG